MNHSVVSYPPTLPPASGGGNAVLHTLGSKAFAAHNIAPVLP